MAERDLLVDLTEAQREAVTHMEGPLLILAAAGSGKTRVITRRVAYLLHQGVHPGNILAITFTNKAAGEMRQRIEALMPGNRVWISTFHSLGARLLRQYADRLGLDRNFTIYDQTDRARVVKMALEDARHRCRADSARRASWGPSARPRTSSSAPNATPSTPATSSRQHRRPGLSRLREALARRQRRWISTICSTGPPLRSSTTRNCAPNSTPASATSSSTNTRTPTRPSTRSPAGFPSITPTCAWWATLTNRFTAFAAPISAISSTSSATSPAPAS